ncbi:MarR family winged helix-turn-helix transcriptional regulator [Holdemania massiliensis]|uniref:MarR family winged helix-turn-helix transcriptional regulator n=1 Tax=Holdemania massiliensis TaxID=1468449 RepID=UPI001F052E0C|nr:MarR family transcriptional regulator [Holdemania massiliensis]MCH1941868.1 MarR family transcriptional regulator [Holdemania massiliensis]
MQRRIGYEIREIQQMIHQKMEQFRHENDCELTFVQTRTIGYLIANQDHDVFQRDLEKELRIRRSTASEILNVLERDGYLYRLSAQQDARLKKLVLTEKALQLNQKMTENIDRMEALLSQSISQQDQEHFFSVLDQIKKNLE